MSAEARPSATPGSHARGLVIVRAGDASLHPRWLGQGRRHFDVMVSYYGSSPATALAYAATADRFESRPGGKWPAIAELLVEHRAFVAGYDAVWFPDDDLAADADVVDRLFAFFFAFQLCLAQPALTRDSFFTWSTVLQEPNCHLRYTRFVEVMAPLFSRDALSACAGTFGESASGWGLDWVWPTLCDRAGLSGIAVVDATPVRHTRPVGGGELYRRHPGLDPRDDAARVIRTYGLAEIRAVAKYSVEREVRDVPVPLRVRLVFWLKKLNGRRKHLASA